MIHKKEHFRAAKENRGNNRWLTEDISLPESRLQRNSWGKWPEVRTTTTLLRIHQVYLKCMRPRECSVAVNTPSPRDARARREYFAHVHFCIPTMITQVHRQMIHCLYRFFCIKPVGIHFHNVEINDNTGSQADGPLYIISILLQRAYV